MGLSALAENIILLRYMELPSQMHRLISILKAGEPGFDPAIREFKITQRGINVAATAESAEAILAGVARPFSSSASTPPESSQDSLPATE